MSYHMIVVINRHNILSNVTTVAWSTGEGIEKGAAQCIQPKCANT